MTIIQMLTEAYQRSLNSASRNLLAQRMPHDDASIVGRIMVVQRANMMILPSLWVISFSETDHRIVVTACLGKMSDRLYATLSMAPWEMHKKNAIIDEAMTLHQADGELNIGELAVPMHDPDMFTKIDEFLSRILRDWLAHNKLDTKKFAVEIEC